MGNNSAFTAFEATTIAAYNKGVLDKELLSEFMEVYRGVDIDSGGMVGTLSRNGLDVEQIVIQAFCHELPKKPNLPKDYREWSDEQHAANDAYHDEVSDLFHGITKRFGW